VPWSKAQVGGRTSWRKARSGLTDAIQCHARSWSTGSSRHRPNATPRFQHNTFIETIVPSRYDTCLSFVRTTVRGSWICHDEVIVLVRHAESLAQYVNVAVVCLEPPGQSADARLGVAQVRRGQGRASPTAGGQRCPAGAPSIDGASPGGPGATPARRRWDVASRPCRAILDLARGTGRLLLQFAVAGPRGAVVPRRDESRAGSGLTRARPSRRPLLDPVEAMGRGTRLPLGGRRERALLALLLTKPGRPVSADRRIDQLWAGERPDGSDTRLRSYVSRLQATLGGWSRSRAAAVAMRSRETHVRSANLCS